MSRKLEVMGGGLGSGVLWMTGRGGINDKCEELNRAYSGGRPKNL